ncbi:xylose isomerase-like TIM barrel protein [Halopolyspora algeriensis]|uniref:Xylose isomerase-like TIM barrel protein n=1 Tax=Halopolyspora algeriensis TaxID=1500506 RepID=A0A368VV99_9ACTN|nr:metabolite traffic protein EboE [Halopolyspora algeriensis]RCW45773.1 xylose isomerase-like TIM barrel protein [Halopolyspora algeriensis]TQM54157.1 xylose isomerase-like TIM barrel protein [Halopolyspora algeriensis]
MRLRHPDGSTVHLAYCTNVHPAEDLDGIIAQLDRCAVPIRERLGTDRLGLGLWLARDVATTLTEDGAALARLRAELVARGLEVVTLNGFPYRGFQQPVVKHAVYRPDWTQRARLDYTLDLARLLTRLLPDDVEQGSISTLPLGWRLPWTDEHARESRALLDELAAGLTKTAVERGRTIRVGFEPEPGCVVETTADAAVRLAGVDTDHLGVCLDTCHLAVGFEDPRQAWQRLAAAGLPVVKAQASCALEVPDPHRPEARAALESFVEPRFLHQTREAAIGRPHGTDDLDEALAEHGPLPGEQPWRVHFHVPLHADPPPPLATTRPVLASSLEELLGGEAARTRHIEVETYTWNVLPAEQRPAGGPVEGIAAELDWTRRHLLALGLTEVTR